MAHSDSKPAPERCRAGCRTAFARTTRFKEDTLIEPVGKVVATFEAPIGEVWAIIAAIGAEKAWIEGVQACSLQGAGCGALRTLTMPDFVAIEKIEECDPELHRVVYRLQDPAGIPLKGAFGTMQLTALTLDRTRLDWLSYAESIDGDKVAMQARITEMYAKSVDNIKRLIAETR